MAEYDREKIIETIRVNAEKIGISFDELSDKDKEYLITIETAITESFELEKRAKEMISRNTVSVKGISKKTNLARQTIYNNPMLKEYINNRSEAFEKVDISRKSNGKDEEIRRLREEVKALHQRDIELEEAKRTIKQLHAELKEKNALIESMRSSGPNLHVYRK